MNFDLDENQALFKAAVERFCEGQDVAARHVQRRAPGGFDRARWNAMANLGLIALAAGDADGGLGGSMLDCAIVAQALGQGLAVEPWLECGFLAARLLGGTEHATSVVSGETLAAFAFAEPGGRYTVDARSTVVRSGKLSGEKRFVLGGGAADLFIISANIDGSTHLFAAPRDATGVDVRPYAVVDGGLAAVVTFRDVAVGDAIGGMDRIEAAIDDSRLIAAAEMAGIARRLFDETLAYVKQREQFGQPIGRFQVIQHRMVDAYAKVEAAQSAVWRALLLPGAMPEATKAFVAEAAQWVAQQAVQLHGGMGMTDELGIGHGLKRILLLAKLFGDPASGIAALAKAA